MRRILSIIVAVTAALAITACGGSGTSAESKAVETVEEAKAATTETQAKQEEGTDTIKTNLAVQDDPTSKEKKEEEEVLPPEILEAGICVSSPANEFNDETYMNFVGRIHNPNKGCAINFPDLTVTLRNPDGTILATSDQMGMYIAPEDTVTLVGMISAPAADLSADTEVQYDIDCSDVSMNTGGKIKTSDFLVENVSERSGSQNYITGEVTNTTDEAIDMAYVSMILRKGGEIVFAENTFADRLKPGKPVAFEFSRYSEWPEHDDIEISVQSW